MDRTPCIAARLRCGLKGAVSAFFVSVLLLGCGGGSSGGASATYSPITEFPEDPTDLDFVDASRAIGFYADGSLSGSGSFGDSGAGWVKISRPRGRRSGTLTMIRTVQLAAAEFRKQFPTGERLQVGDIAAPNGGYISGHASHQNGLDGDFGYFTNSGVELDPNSSSSNAFPEEFVRSGRVTSNFNMAKNWAILRNLVARGNVNRIFVDPAIKNAFCKQAPTLDPTLSFAARTEVLRRLSPYKNHGDHFHMRLQCPPNHPKCKVQSNPSSGSGCSSVSATNEGEVEVFEEKTLQQIEDEDLGEDEA